MTIPRVLFFTVPKKKKKGYYITFSQVIGTSADCHNFSYMMECGLATTSTNSLSTLECILSWTSVCSADSGDVEADLLQWEGYHSSSPCFEFQEVERCGKIDC